MARDQGACSRDLAREAAGGALTVLEMAEDSDEVAAAHEITWVSGEEPSGGCGWWWR